jgi:lysophospholipase L1-like esterase
MTLASQALGGTSGIPGVQGVQGVRGRILVLGDSISAGATVIEGMQILERVANSFVEHVARQAPDLNVTVDAVPWRRTPELAEGVPSLLAAHDPDVVVIATGANDADIEWKRYVVSNGRVVRSRTRLVDFTAALGKLAVACAKHGAVMIATEVISPALRLRAPLLSAAAGRDLWPLIQESGGQAACDKIVEDYRGAAHDEGKRSGFAVARTGSALGDAPHEQVYAADGVHPNDEGHRILGTALAPLILPALRRA